MKPDLTLLTGGFSGHKENQIHLLGSFTNSGWVDSVVVVHSLIWSCRHQVATKITKVTTSTKIDLKPGTESWCCLDLKAQRVSGLSSLVPPHWGHNLFCSGLVV
jgi:hypothetical protein